MTLNRRITNLESGQAGSLPVLVAQVPIEWSEELLDEGINKLASAQGIQEPFEVMLLKHADVAALQVTFIADFDALLTQVSESGHRIGLTS
jgi:hypothetical protein